MSQNLCRSVFTMCFLSLITFSAHASVAPPSGTSIQMLPPIQSATASTVCKENDAAASPEGNKILTWDGKTSIKCNKDITIEPTGNVGIGTTAPLAKLDVRGTTTISSNATVGGNAIVAGSVKVGNDVAACIAAKQGTVRWNGATMQYCNGAAWVNFASAPTNPAQCGEGSLMQWDQATNTTTCKPIYAATKCARYSNFTAAETGVFKCPAPTKIVSGSCWRKEHLPAPENWNGGLWVGDTVDYAANTFSCRIEGSDGVYVTAICCE